MAGGTWMARSCRGNVGIGRKSATDAYGHLRILVSLILSLSSARVLTGGCRNASGHPSVAKRCLPRRSGRRHPAERCAFLVMKFTLLRISDRHFGAYIIVLGYASLNVGPARQARPAPSDGAPCGKPAFNGLVALDANEPRAVIHPRDEMNCAIRSAASSGFVCRTKWGASIGKSDWQCPLKSCDIAIGTNRSLVARRYAQGTLISDNLSRRSTCDTARKRSTRVLNGTSRNTDL